MKKSIASYAVRMIVFLTYFFVPLFSFGQIPDRETVERALRKAVGFYREQVSTEGGYLWKYSSDLTLREGENVADDQTVWVQSPGTPQIGVMLLRAYAVTGDPYYLEGAVAAGHCLVRGQLRSGGWDYRICFNPEQRKKYDKNGKYLLHGMVNGIFFV